MPDIQVKPGRPLLLRTAYCLDLLRQNLGIGAPTIYKRVCENQFERFGLKCMSYESVRDLFRGRATPGVDPPLMNDPAHDMPWLFALELEFPGSTDAFFHVAFDLLWGEVESRYHWSTRAQKVPAAWIEEARSKGRDRLAQDWIEENTALSKRGRRKRPAAHMHGVEVAHLALLRLPPAITDALFESIRASGYVSRRLGVPQTEAEACQRDASLNGLAALMALLVEAEALTDRGRFHTIRRSVRSLLPQVLERPECRRIAGDLGSAVEAFCRGRSPYRNAAVRYYSGKPTSWLVHLAPPVVHYFEEIFGHPPE